MSKRTLERTIFKLEKMQLLISMKPWRSDWKQTKWYTIDYAIVKGWEDSDSKRARSEDLEKPTETAETLDFPDSANLAESIPTVWRNQECQIGGINNRDFNTDISFLNTKQETLNTEHEYSSFQQGEDFPEEGFLNQGREEVCKPLTSVSKKEESIATMKKSGEGTSSAAPPKTESIRVAKKKRKTTIRNQVNDLGWLQMDRRSRFKLARYVATQRLSIALADLNGYSRGFDQANNYFIRRTDRDSWIPIADAFSSDCFDFGSLRDEAIENGALHQEAFNALLEAIFEASVDWCDDRGQSAKQTIADVGIFDLFYDRDRDFCDRLRKLG